MSLLTTLALSGGGATSSTPALILPDGWDTGWKAAEAASATTPCWVAALGDSFTQGLHASNPLTTSWFGLLRTALIAQYGEYATLYSVSNDVQHGAGYSPVPWVNSQTAISLTAASGFGEVSRYTGIGVGTQTFTTPVACTDMDIYYQSATASNFDYAVDGAAATTQAVAGSVAFNVIQLRGLANTTHTIVFNNQSVSLAMRIMGVAVYNNLTHGVGFANMGVSGLASNAWSNVSTNHLLRGDLGSMTAFPTKPHLLIIAMGINDCSQQTIGPQSFYSIYRTLIMAARRARPALSVLLIANCNPSTLYGDVTTPFGNSDSWGLYVGAMRQLAQDTNAAFFNCDAKWGPTPLAQGFVVSAANGHPNDAGNANMYASLAEVLL